MSEKTPQRSNRRLQITALGTTLGSLAIVAPTRTASEQTWTFRTLANRWPRHGGTTFDRAKAKGEDVPEKISLHVRSAVLLATRHMIVDHHARFNLTNECAVRRLPEAAWRIAKSVNIQT